MVRMERNHNEDSFLTVAEVAETLKLNQQTVRNWIDRGELPAVRVGRRVRIKRADFDRLLDEGYSAGAGAGANSNPGGAAGTSSGAGDSGPSADDFWGGEQIAIGEPDVRR
jgi:excisionase family DNA binding protein